MRASSFVRCSAALLVAAGLAHASSLAEEAEPELGSTIIDNGMGRSLQEADAATECSDIAVDACAAEAACGIKAAADEACASTEASSYCAVQCAQRLLRHCTCTHLLSNAPLHHVFVSHLL